MLGDPRSSKEALPASLLYRSRLRQAREAGRAKPALRCRPGAGDMPLSATAGDMAMAGAAAVVVGRCCCHQHGSCKRRLLPAAVIQDASRSADASVAAKDRAGRAAGLAAAAAVMGLEARAWLMVRLNLTVLSPCCCSVVCRLQDVPGGELEDL
jgi:hypothetical protein